MSKIIALVLGDIKNFKRDIVLGATIFGPIAMAVLIKFAVPIATELLYEKSKIDLKPYYFLIIGIALMLVPMLIGGMTGLILLEDKDEKMLLYYAVTPLGKKGYMLYRIISPICMNVLLSFFLVYFTNLIHINFLKLFCIVLMASIEAILVALLLGAFGENRVDGLTIMKALGILYAVPIIDTFINFRYSWTLGIFPTYWVPKAIGFSNTSSYFIGIFILGFVIHMVYVMLLFRKFEEKL